MSSQDWVIVGVVLVSLGLWALLQGVETRMASRKTGLGDGHAPPRSEQKDEAAGNATEALELARIYLGLGEKDIALRYIDEVLDIGTERERALARQLTGEGSG
ncbi:MAG: hypothetical protein F4Z15_01250 [Gammaproteobacteria bacterium]|nr:hypothetical protein [Gammaproteobacteria bacterium]MYD76786.1 hypothetical protein [Gammaproteobacteria bacterium]MYJ52617.1 hypothetical protein [Gammaproteobacteria bacterium]